MLLRLIKKAEGNAEQNTILILILCSLAILFLSKHVQPVHWKLEKWIDEKITRTFLDKHYFSLLFFGAYVSGCCSHRPLCCRLTGKYTIQTSANTSSRNSHFALGTVPFKEFLALGPIQNCSSNKAQQKFIYFYIFKYMIIA